MYDAKKKTWRLLKRLGEICGAALRLARGVEVNDESLALDLASNQPAKPAMSEPSISPGAPQQNF